MCSILVTVLAQTVHSYFLTLLCVDTGFSNVSLLQLLLSQFSQCFAFSAPCVSLPWFIMAVVVTSFTSQFLHLWGRSWVCLLSSCFSMLDDWLIVLLQKWQLANCLSSCTCTCLSRLFVGWRLLSPILQSSSCWWESTWDFSCPWGCGVSTSRLCQRVRSLLTSDHQQCTFYWSGGLTRASRDSCFDWKVSGRRGMNWGLCALGGARQN